MKWFAAFLGTNGSAEQTLLQNTGLMSRVCNIFLVKLLFHVRINH